MFDDFVLLAKGGLTVYHGPVKKVEDYFAGLGIKVPEHVNPPDHFIDILEGLEKPSSVSREQLPVRWMLHNGYSVPLDMLELVDKMTSTDSNKSDSDSSEQSSGGGSSNSERKQLFSGSSKDLSNRVTPGILLQYKYFLGRY